MALGNPRADVFRADFAVSFAAAGPSTIETMKFNSAPAPTLQSAPQPAASSGEKPIDAERAQISQNIAAVLGFYAREEEKMSASQRLLERVSDFIGRPTFIALILFFSALWIIVTVALRRLGIVDFDPPPFFWLQGIVGLGALLTATAVLSKQNRLAKLTEQRAHLELEVTLLTEQKVAKLIELLEELRRDLPDVPDRHDAAAVELKQSMNPEQVLAALDERGEAGSADKANKAADDKKPN